MIKTEVIHEVEITGLAGLGHGVTHVDGQTVFVPFTMAGERWRVRMAGSAKGALMAEGMECLRAHPQRRKPVCPSFGICGGCELQHLDEVAYNAFKMQIARDAAQALGAGEEVVAALYKVPEYTRRRAQWKAQTVEGRLRLGFFAAKSHILADTSSCVVVTQRMRGFISALEAFWPQACKGLSLSAVHVTDIASGFDVVMEGKGRLSPAIREKVAEWLRVQGVVRALWRGGEGDVYLLYGKPQTTFDGVAVALSEEAFLQATHASQEFMIQQVKRGVGNAESVIDLYAGSGTYTLPLAVGGRRVYAFEGWRPAVEALHNALRLMPCAGQVEVTQRDLVKAPVSADLLALAGAVVINPPRNGALPQVREIAGSGVERVVMVSCNPATFVRDAKVLQSAGFRLVELIPVDQFLYSHHLEFIGFFAQ